MNHNYPHIDDTAFPDISNVNVYKYENEYDYDQYTDSVKVKMLNVSWCSDYENTVYFETKAARDAWFDNQDGLVKEMSSMFRLYNDGSIKVDIPIDECMQYNYVMIDYGKLPQQTTATKDSKMFYFVKNIVQASVNATELVLSVDYWTSYINDMSVQYVNLTRGHWPMAQTTVANYLNNPIENSEYLLTDDVSYGDFNRTASITNIIFNDSASDMFLGFLTNGNVNDGYNGSTWSGQTSTLAYYSSQMYSAVDTFVIGITDWNEFRNTIDANCPQFWQTVKGMFVVSGNLLNHLTGFTFFGINCYAVDSTGDKISGTFDITQDKFGYIGKPAQIAKLYTYPYAAIEVSDFKGSTMMLKVEDTVGSISIHTIMNDMYPFLNVEAYMTGIAGSVSSAITFKTAQDNTMTIGGRQYEFTTKWSIPVFAVQLTAAEDWALNGDINATSVKTNAYDTASTNNTNDYAIAANIISNTGEQTNANTDNNGTVVDTNVLIANRNNFLQTAIANIQKGKMDDDMSSDNYFIGASTEIQNTTSYMVAVNNGSTSWTQSAISAGGNTVSSSLSGSDGVAGSVASGVANVINAGASAMNLEANTIIGIGTSEALSDLQQALNLSKTNIAKAALDSSITYLNANRSDTTGYNNTAQNSITTRNNTMLSNVATNNSNLTKANADRNKTLAEANADRSYNAANNQTLIANHPQFGQLTGTPDIVNKPFGLSYNVVTQSKNAIRQAAEQFMRYGYFLNMEVDISSFNVMPNFTYWQCDKVYCNDRGVFGGAQDVIKSILNNGTTVWRDPSKIGVTSIYDNIEVTNE